MTLGLPIYETTDHRACCRVPQDQGFVVTTRYDQPAIGRECHAGNLTSVADKTAHRSWRIGCLTKGDLCRGRCRIQSDRVQRQCDCQVRVTSGEGCLRTSHECHIL